MIQTIANQKISIILLIYFATLMIQKKKKKKKHIGPSSYHIYPSLN